MELHAVGLSWDAGAEGTRWDAAARLGTKWEHYTDVRSLQCGAFADLRIVAHTVAV